MRFTDFLRYHHRSIIPKSVDVSRYLDLLSGVEKTVLKLRSKRNKFVMSRSRTMYHMTLKTMAEWKQQDIMWKYL